MAINILKLSSAQSQIISAPVGRAIQVLASAGSGKTRVLTERIRHILSNQAKGAVVALTFTNKAAEEMHDRLEDIDDLEERCYIGTIHSFAQKIIHDYGHTIGLNEQLHIYEREQDKKVIFTQALQNSGIDLAELFGLDEHDDKTINAKLNILLNEFSSIKRNVLSEQDINSKHRDEGEIFNLFKIYNSALLAGAGMDFDDILLYAIKILLTQPWCGKIYRTKYRYVCIDEAQDLNKAQYEFIKAFCQEGLNDIMLVGDPNQMIYGFNDSSHDYLTKYFIDDFKPIKFTLTENYRSTKAVISLANSIKPNSQAETVYALRGYAELRSLPDELVEAEWVITKIKELLAVKTHKEIEGEISLSKMVIIARNRFVFRAIEEELERASIPYYYKKSERNAEYTSTIGKLIDLGLRLKINPKDWIDGNKLCAALDLNKPKDRKDILAHIIEKINERNSGCDSYHSKILSAINQLSLDEPNIRKLVDFTSSIIQTLKETAVLDDYLANELALSQREINEFLSLWTQFKRKGLGTTLNSFRNAIALGQVGGSSDGIGLALSSVHTMKGLEKDIVFIIGLCEGVFPDYRAKTPKDLIEEKNNMFVAITRARRWIYISYPQRRMMPWNEEKAQAASRFYTTMKQATQVGSH